MPVGSREKSNEAPLGADATSLDSFPSLSFSTLLGRVNLTSVTLKSSLGRSADSHGDYSTSLSLSTQASFALTFLLGHLFSLLSPSRSFSFIFFFQRHYRITYCTLFFTLCVSRSIAFSFSFFKSVITPYQSDD